MAKLSIFSLSETVLNGFYTFSNVLLMPRAAFQWIRNRKELNRNRQLKDSAKYNRCFILGAGPSLSKVNLDLLINQPVITVNRLYLLEAFDELSPVFHCALDPGMCNGVYKEEFFKVISSHPSIRFLLSGNVPDSFKELDNTYICQLGFIPSRQVKPFRLDRPSAAFANVVQFAIELAMYMGYKEIVLLGCDFNQFASRTDTHVYDSIVAANNRTLSMTYELLTHTIMLLQYGYIREYAEKNNITILNATRGSLLDVFHSINFEDIIARN